MEEETKNEVFEDIRSVKKQPKTDRVLPVSIFISAIIIAGAWVYAAGLKNIPQRQTASTLSPSLQKTQGSELEEKVIPSEGVVLPATWGDLGAKLVNVGAIDADQFKTIYEQRGSFTDEYKNLLLGQSDGRLKITQDNAGYLLNLFWALGLAQKNQILESGEMVDPRYGGTQNFASTGGWTIAKGNAMDHYSRHVLFRLTPEQQALVDKISKGIYRPCCGNSTHFPDCNHGMAMLGLLELMASQGASEDEMWRAALAANSYWFPDIYLTVATYMKDKGIDWKDVSPQEVLGADYSSAPGYARISAQISQPQPVRSGGGCGIDTGQPVQPQPQRRQGGCGI